MILICTQAVTAEGAQETGRRSITVSGRGSISATPDMVSMNLGVQSNNIDLNTAIEDSNSRIENIIAVIHEFGIPDTDYRTSNFSVYYQQPYKESSDKGTYNVNNNIFIEVQDVSIIGKFIQQALNAGANQFYGLEYGISKPSPLMKQARQLAIENAIALAKETAGYADLSISEIISIEETPYYGGGSVYAEGMSLSRDSNSIITAPGEKTIEVQVKLVIGIK
jgi:hypothetical protein